MICLKILDPILKNQEKCGSSLIEMNFNILEIIQFYQNVILCEKCIFLFFLFKILFYQDNILGSINITHVSNNCYSATFY